ncbi:MAG: hypothetical protein ACXVGQ_14825, partial [Mycobacteriaceae bacterium]
MSDATSLLFDLSGFRVVSCALTPLGVRQVVVMQTAAEHVCPRCGVLVSYDSMLWVRDLKEGAAYLPK